MAEKEEPPSSVTEPDSMITNLPAARPETEVTPYNGHDGGAEHGLMGWLRQLIHNNKDDDNSLRDALEEYVENGLNLAPSSIAAHERALLSNILKLRDMTVFDVMIPRADITAVELGMSQEQLLGVLAEKQFSRFPVYRETLDDIVGTIHIKDILASLAQNQPVTIPELVREVQIVSPAMHVLDLLLMMKQMRKHMAMVVDEYGGIDGLVTVGDVIEAIVGDIDDEHDDGSDEPRMIVTDDDTVLADARVDIDEFEERFGYILTEEEREDHDTLGGLVFALAGRVPARGEILTHPTGMVFEVLDADPRRVNRVRIRNIPTETEQPMLQADY